MTIPDEGRLFWRQTAPFHVQLKLEKSSDREQPLGEQQVQGIVVRLFRADGRLEIGDRVVFPLWVCRRGDPPTGEAFIYEDAFSRAEYIEAYLTGTPPQCRLAAYEFCVVDAPSDRSVLTADESEQVPIRRPWQFWKSTSEDDGWEVWRRRSDDQVIAGMLHLRDYTAEGQLIIRSEMVRRCLTLPNPFIHTYAVKNPAGGMMDVVSVLPPEVVFTHGLVMEAVVGRWRKRPEDGGTLTPENFDANPVFADLLHDVIARHGPNEPDLIDEARRHGSGKVYLIDGRNSAPDGGVAPRDIVGSFVVDGGMVIAGSYERNPNHAVLSAIGFFRVGQGIHEHLAAELALRKMPDKNA